MDIGRKEGEERDVAGGEMNDRKDPDPLRETTGRWGRDCVQVSRREDRE